MKKTSLPMLPAAGQGGILFFNFCIDFSQEVSRLVRLHALGRAGVVTGAVTTALSLSRSDSPSTPEGWIDSVLKQKFNLSNINKFGPRIS